MGLLFNTKATTKMLGIVNDAFDAGSIGTWRTIPASGPPAPMEYFNAAGPNKKPLNKIAVLMNIFGGSGQGSQEDKRFQKWLKGLETLGVGDTICAQVYQGLDDSNCAEIFFVVIPSSQITVGSPSKVGTPSSYTWVIMISTVQANQVAAFIKRHRERLEARRAARKKKP